MIEGASREATGMLRQIPLFQGLTDEELLKIEHLLIRREFAEKQPIFHQEEPLEAVYFIAAGKVKIFRNDEMGREQVVNLLQAGDMFPHVGFFRTDAVYPAHSAMLEEGVLLALPTARFRALIETNAPLCVKLMAVLETKYMDLQGRLAEMVMHDTFGRIVSLLIRLSRLHGESDGECGVRLNIPLTNQDLANMIGTSRETVNRTLSQLKKAGAVRVTNDHHLLVQVELLEQQLRI